MLVIVTACCFCFFFFKQKTAYEMRISDWSSDVCSSDLEPALLVTVNASPSVTDSAPLAPAIDIPVASPPAAFTVTAAQLPVAALAAVVIVTSVPSCVVIPVALAPVLVPESSAPAKSTDKASVAPDSGPPVATPLPVTIRSPL